MFSQMSRIAIVVLLWSAPLAAQDYTGTYSATNDQGGQTTVTLHQQGQNVTGTISGLGNTFALEGVLEEGAIVGTMTGNQGAGFWLEAQVDDAQLYLTLVEPDAYGQPNFETATVLVFDRVATAGSAHGSDGAVNPLAPRNPATTSQDPWVGTFSDGNLTVTLQGSAGSYSGTVDLSGQTFPLAMTGGGTSLSGTFQTADGQFEAQMSQSQGEVYFASGGATYTLHRGSDGEASNPLAGGGSGQQVVQQSDYGQSGTTDQPAAGSLHDGTPQAIEWAQWLAGMKATKMESYSSGSAGGYSSRTDVHLCPNGQFGLNDQSSVSVDTGGAYGYSGGSGAGSGTWRVFTQGAIVGIELRYSNGQTEQHRLEYDYQNSATYVDGERWYITQSEACGY